MYAVTTPQPTATPTVLAAFTAFFESLWSPATGTVSAAQKSGMTYVYDEDGTLIADTLTGGATTTWGQSAKYIYLPTASGPMPVAVIYGSGNTAKHYAVQSDHLNTPRRLVQSDGQVAWQWAYSAFGDEQPTIANNRFANTALNQSFGTTSVPAVTFNLRYPGQYFDQESSLHYNYHRSYCPGCGRYTQSDPIDLQGGWNRFAYAESNPIEFVDPEGLQTRQAPPSISYSNGLISTRVEILITTIRQYNPSYSYQTIRPSTGSGRNYNNSDVASLTGILRGYQNAQACTRDGVVAGRFIGDQNGNVMLEPVGGSTGPYPPHRPNSPDTHTYYPNGSNYMRNNPQGHGSNTTPHGHGHLPGTGPGRSGQGSSTDFR